MVKHHFLNNVIQFGGVPEDDIRRYVDEGLFTIYTFLGFEKIKPTQYIELYLSETTHYYVNLKLKEQKKAIERNKRLGHIDQYVHERDPWLGFKLRTQGQRYICPECLKVNVPCNCDVDKKRLHVTAKLPRKNASKKKWKEFRNKFNI